VTSAHGSPSGANWYDAGATATFAVTSPDTSGTTQYVFTVWSGDSSASTASATKTMDAAHAVTANWQTQYNVSYATTGNVVSVAAPSDEWVNSGGVATGVFPVQVTIGGSRSNFASDDRPLTITAPTTVTGTYSNQYQLTVTSAHGITSGAGWYPAGSMAYAGLSTGTVSGGAGIQYVFTGWSSDASGISFSSSNAITMNAPKTATANWNTQYQVTFAVSGSGSTNPSGSNVWANASFLFITASPNAGYTFSYWSSKLGQLPLVMLILLLLPQQ
jgi:hypothetical protein